MKVADTNVFVRILVEDDASQAAQSKAILAAGVVITSGVWIEIEWVLRSSYKLPRDRIVDALALLLRLEGVATFDREGMKWAIARYADGADWADMIHLVDASGHDAFVTFDRALIRQAGADTPLPIEVLA